MSEETSIETKIKMTRRGYKLFDYFMAFFMLMAVLSVWEFFAADIEAKPVGGLRALKDLAMAFGFRALRNLFRTVADVLEELKGTV